MISRTHPIAKRLRALRADRDARDRELVLVGEGLHLADEALRSRASIELAVVSPRLQSLGEGKVLAARLAAAGIEVHEASDGTLESLTDARAPQPVLVLVRRVPRTLDDVVRGRGGVPLLVVASGIQDPGNLGAILRVADAAGATGVVAIRGGTDLFHPRAVRASAGAIFRIPAVEAEAGPLHAALRRASLRMFGADPRDGARYDAVDWTGPVALLVGAEGAGIAPELGALLDARVTVPMHAGTESLSVATAAAVVLFEAARARSSRAG